MTTFLVDNGKSPDELYNATLGFWLPPDTPYGNFQLKFMKLCERVDEANRRIIESCRHWKLARAGVLLVNALARHVYANEQAVYLLRRAADDMIALIWCLSEWEVKGIYPQQIVVDCIGAILKQPVERQMPFCSEHIEVLKALNEIANAFKHSFVHSDVTLIGRDEPRLHALSLDHNKLVSGARFHDVSLAWLVKGFSAFYQAGVDWLRSFSEKHR